MNGFTLSVVVVIFLCVHKDTFYTGRIVSIFNAQCGSQSDLQFALWEVISKKYPVFFNEIDKNNTK